MLSCKQAIRLVSEQLDRELPFWRRVWLRLHVAMCRACGRYTRQVKGLDQAVRQRYGGDSAARGPVRLPDEALERIKASLRSSGPSSDSQQTG